MGRREAALQALWETGGHGELVLPVPRAGIPSMLVGPRGHQAIPQEWLCQGPCHREATEHGHVGEINPLSLLPEPTRQPRGEGGEERGSEVPRNLGKAANVT